MNNHSTPMLTYVLISLLLCFSMGAQLSAQEIIFQDDFESGVLDQSVWTSLPSIAGASGGRIEVVENPDGANSGSFYLLIGRNTDGALTTNALDLNLDLSGQTDIELRFALRSYFEETQEGEGLYFSDDGGATFKFVYQFNLGEETQNVYNLSPNIDVDALAKANDLNLTSTFVIRIQQIGSGNFTTSGDEDGFIIDDITVFDPEIQFVGLPFEDGFESGVLGPMWQEANPSEPANGQPTAPGFAPNRFGSAVRIIESQNSNNGSFQLRIGRSRDGNLTTSALDLYLNLEGLTEVELRFFLRSFFDATEEEEGLYFSDDGGLNFVQVYNFNQGEEAQNVYLSSPRIDVDALAEANGLNLSSTFIIRFQQIGSGNFNTSGDEDGFIIDDISVFVPEIEYTSIPFSDGFEDGNIGPMWQEADASEPSYGQPTAPGFAPTRLGSTLFIGSSENSNSGSFQLLNGRSVDGVQTTSALDLLLNLEGQKEVELRFFLRSYFDETQEQEGLYFSDNGGENFVQVYRFNQGEERQNFYQLSPNIDVDALAEANGLSLSSNFIIRFQQIGTGNFNTSGDEDGFILDDVAVFSPEIEYAILPFEDDFETGTFRPMWSEANPSEPAMGVPTAPNFAPHRFGGRVSIFSSTSGANNGSFYTGIGRSSDGNQTTSALDLRLNLEGKNNVLLRFFWRDVFDQTQEQEGIYFSSDSGNSFVQVVALDPSNNSNQMYSEQVVDVSALAEANNLSLTSTFVIRFQQIGTGDFNTSGDEDGFLIDDVSVSADMSTSLENTLGDGNELGQNYPNPFQEVTVIPYQLSRSTSVRLSLYNLYGQQMGVLFEGKQSSGNHEVKVDVAHLPVGTYFYELTLDRNRKARRLLTVEGH